MKLVSRDLVIGSLARFPGVRRRIVRVVGVRPRRGYNLRQSFEDHLRELNSHLDSSGVLDLVWIWSGLMLGWAREGRALEHDLQDADFCVLRSDWDAFWDVLKTTNALGFAVSGQITDNEGRLALVKLNRGVASYDFSLVDRIDSCFETFAFGVVSRPTQFRVRVPAQSLERIDLGGSSWNKVSDHEKELEALYGDWKTPDPSFSFMDSCPAIVERSLWISRKEYLQNRRK